MPAGPGRHAWRRTPRPSRRERGDERGRARAARRTEALRPDGEDAVVRRGKSARGEPKNVARSREARPERMDSLGKARALRTSARRRQMDATPRRRRALSRRRSHYERRDVDPVRARHTEREDDDPRESGTGDGGGLEEDLVQGHRRG